MNSPEKRNTIDYIQDTRNCHCWQWPFWQPDSDHPEIKNDRLRKDIIRIAHIVRGDEYKRLQIINKEIINNLDRHAYGVESYEMISECKVLSLNDRL